MEIEEGDNDCQLQPRDQLHTGGLGRTVILLISKFPQESYQPES